ncbi:hypothetical protein DACRYDRAFT_119506 [Dacryopinax primogenitus]|uniref:Uncharacterized protein n=1 Tax=Dacryopinax primogenitus (strain DJM 731) TaxID=1858805 RepID=M5G0T0_DACPD|nr:uncharacterized protein DACRYDRAFT_119506 [Dacryopinax primogenitus]EJT97402.1 hypothetical protein DACRYDRAFT_119506 [Dacryopinax primogenitus]
MYNRKTAAMLLWPSRPTSPAPTGGEAIPTSYAPDLQRGVSLSRPLNALMRPSLKEATDVGNAGLVAESYCTLLGMKLNEAVAKALMGGTEGPVWDRRRSVPWGKGKSLGMLISGEFTNGSNSVDTFTQRAILRTVQRPLSVLLSNIQGLLTPLLASPQFLPTSPLPPSLSAAQVHALALAAFAGELSDALLIPNVPRFVNEGLAPYRAQLSALETRAGLPIVAALKGILVGLAVDLENATAGIKEHGSLAALNQSVVGASKLLQRLLGAEPTDKRQIWAAELLANVAWEGMVSLVYRPRATMRAIFPERKSSPPLGITHAAERVDVPSRFGIKQLVSRPVTPSVPQRPVTPSTLSRDAHALQSFVTALSNSCAVFTNSLASELRSEALLSLAQLHTLFSLAPPSTLVDIPELELLPSAIVLTYLLPEGKVASLLGMDAGTFRGRCLKDENSAERCEQAVEQVVRDWVADKDGWAAVHRWLVGDSSACST